ncbi:MAG TPA: YbaK/EbsC family protein [Pseudolysinimonas sp.]|jgi:prolyl-tRNA editing enzyme YbaK/EbsC (Cys-tRNA(Pro) deacylase)|nr:YbaK/EbsC family protein [Pseudolysinimonas sp.]
MTSPAVERFLASVAPLGLVPEVREFDESTHTAAEAAAAIGCEVAAIVKSLLFDAGGEPLLVLASGPNRVNTAALSARLGVEIGKADAGAVKQATGYSIGAVPPLGHRAALRTIFDETLLELPVVWAAAGSATAVFAIAPAELVRLTDAEVSSVLG